jgi:hypothetical protein
MCVMRLCVSGEELKRACANSYHKLARYSVPSLFCCCCCCWRCSCRRVVLSVSKLKDRHLEMDTKSYNVLLNALIQDDRFESGNSDDSSVDL